MQFPAVSQSKRDATVAAQYVLNLMNPTAPIKVDGVIGARTLGAFQKLDSAAQQSVSTFIASRNPSVAATIKGDSSVPFDSSRYISKDAAYDLIDQAIRKYGQIRGLSGVTTQEFMRWKLNIEAARIHDGYDIRSGEGSSYQGLYQHGLSAWTDVRNKTPALRDVPYLTGVFNPQFSTEGGLRYAQISADYMSNLGYKGPLTKEVLYAAYNQGATGFLRQGSPWYDVQSRVAKPILQQAAKTANVKIAGA